MKAKFGEGAPVDAIKKFINRPMIAADHIRYFLLNEQQKDVRAKIGIDDSICKHLLEILNDSEKLTQTGTSTTVTSCSHFFYSTPYYSRVI